MDAFVTKHLIGVSRTYALVVPMLPDRLSHAVGVAYLLMRIVDTLEDASELSTARRLEHFDRLAEAIAGDDEALRVLARPIGDNDHERKLMRDLPQVLDTIRALDPAYRDAIYECAAAMADGVCGLITRSAERGVAYPAVQDLGELRQYCYYVAGVVGEMLCSMMAHHLGRPSLLEMQDAAVELGTGLQLVNIVKDAPSDATHGRRYLPPASDEESCRSIRETVIKEARRCLWAGTDYVLAIPPDATGLRIFSGLPIVWGALTLLQAGSTPDNAKISREAIFNTIARFEKVAGDDAYLRTWFASMLSESVQVDAMSVQ